MASPKITKYDLFVIGGGSAGLACAVEAARNGKKVGLADFVKPSVKGSKWGSGGTCINVGCNTFRLMAQSSFLGLIRPLQKNLGFDIIESGQCSWKRLQEINSKITKKNSWGAKSNLSSNLVRYYNKWAKIVGPNTVELSVDRAAPEIIQTNHIVIATGSRPKIPAKLENIQNHLLTSDDLCLLKEDPNDTLIIGGGFISVEVGSFLAGLGKRVTIICRSLFLRIHDNTGREKVKAFLASIGVKIIENIEEYSLSHQDKKFTLALPQENKILDQEFDTVLVATGRESRVIELFAEDVKILFADDGKIIVDDNECTNIPGIFAVGDCASKRPCFSPPSKKAGINLGRRLSDEQYKSAMSYDWIPYSFFTGLFEFSSIGMSEESAVAKIGRDNVKTWFQSRNKINDSLIWGQFKDHLFFKVVYRSQDQRVLGVHTFGPKTSELIMGYSIPLSHGMTLDQLVESLDFLEEDPDFEDTFSVEDLEIELNKISKEGALSQDQEQLD